MRNLMIFAAAMVGAGVYMAQMADDKMSRASAHANAPRTAAVEAPAPAGGRTLSIPRLSLIHISEPTRPY